MSLIVQVITGKGLYSKWGSNPVMAAVYIVGNDHWGVNRRNVLIYETTAGENSTSVKIRATFDGGGLIGRKWGNPELYLLESL